ncbi:MAG: NADH-quinone oxidoreductase subunit NuoH [Chitinophagales bacterium]|nr:NADH-quinone oxidoreductase subunit NuoH [Chitinophagaceae bacterium]MBP9884468.1 NADH-quinone oxidoreductase subunit NuoH [Chitinophagales bacterium]
MTLLSLLPTLILIVALFAVTMLVALYSTFAERKVAAFLQDRVGPNRAGPGGIFQPLADGVKFFMKEEVIPVASNKFLFVLGPCIAIMCALMTGIVVPWGDTLTLFGASIPLQIVDLDIGILYVFAVVSVGVYGIMIGGWASNNKFSLMGAIRASSQIISYEISMGLSIVALLLVTGTMSLHEIVTQQHGMHWNIFYQPLGFLLFLICAFAETNRTPFDLPECETELVGGYHTEYSSMKLGFYLFSEYINMFISGAIMATLFFGGYNFPFMDNLLQATGSQNLVTIIGTAFLFLKIFFFIFFFMWVRWTIPRFRYDQLMNLGWKGLIPLGIFNVVATAVGLLFFRN